MRGKKVSRRTQGWWNLRVNKGGFGIDSRVLPAQTGVGSGCASEETNQCPSPRLEVAIRAPDSDELQLYSIDARLFTDLRYLYNEYPEWNSTPNDLQTIDETLARISVVGSRGKDHYVAKEAMLLLQLSKSAPPRIRWRGIADESSDTMGLCVVGVSYSPAVKDGQLRLVGRAYREYHASENDLEAPIKEADCKRTHSDKIIVVGPMSPSN